MTHLDPDKMDESAGRAVAAWLEANGCRHYVATTSPLEPVLIRGNHVEYTAMCRLDSKSTRRMPAYADGRVEFLGRKTLRIRVPLRHYLGHVQGVDGWLAAECIPDIEAALTRLEASNAA